MTFADTAGAAPQYAEFPFELSAIARFSERQAITLENDRLLASLLDQWFSEFVQGTFAGVTASAVQVSQRLGPNPYVWPRSMQEAASGTIIKAASPIEIALIGQEQVFPTRLDTDVVIGAVFFPFEDKRIGLSIRITRIELVRGSGVLWTTGKMLVGGAAIFTAIAMTPQYQEASESWKWEQRIERSIEGEICTVEGRVTADLGAMRQLTARELNIWQPGLDAETLRDRTCNLQALLKINGAAPGALDGVPGPDTDRAYDYYRRAHGLLAYPRESEASLGNLVYTVQRPLDGR